MSSPVPGALRTEVARDGETIVFVAPARLLETMRWLKETPGQEFDYLVDVTAVEFRDRERPLQVVYFLRSLSRKADVRVKVELPASDELAVDSVWSLWHGADWLEREVFDMFGVTFRGHPDLRRILMWETRCAAASPVPSRCARRSTLIPRRTTRWRSCRSPKQAATCPTTCAIGCGAVSAA